MAKIEFDIPKSALTEAAKNKIDKLEKEVKKKDTKIFNLERKISKQEATVNQANNFIQKFHDLYDTLQDKFHDPYHDKFRF